MNKKLENDSNITDDEFITIAKFYDFEPIKNNGRLYFNLYIDSSFIRLIKKNLFIFIDNNYKYNNINIINCNACKKSIGIERSYDITIGCSQRKYRWHKNAELDDVVNGVMG